MVWVRSYCERKVFTSLTLGTKFWSIAGLQSTCYGRAVELELKLSLLIEQRTVLAGNGNLTPIPTKAEASPRHFMKTALKEGHRDLIQSYIYDEAIAPRLCINDCA